MLQHPESPAGQNGRNEDANSDSGDSLFITQVPVPEAVRSQRRRRATLRSEISFSDDPLNEDYIFPVTDSGKSDTEREKKGQTNRLPKLSFPFLSENWQRSIELPPQQNRKLHYALMGGFFKCVREQWESYQRGEDLVESLPTIDMVGDHIDPISEEEDGFEDEDIKVVDKKLFVVPSKAKRSKPWYNPTDKAPGGQTRRPSVAGFEAQRRQRKRVERGLTWNPSLKSVPLSGRKRSDGGNTFHAVSGEGETGNQVTSDENIETQAEPQSLKRPKRKIFNPEENENELDGNSSAAVCQISPKKAAETIWSAAEVEPQSDDGHRDHEPESPILLRGDDDDDTPCSETRVKKKKKKKDKRENEAVEEGRDQSQEEAEGKHAGDSVSAGITEVEEDLSLSQAMDEPEPPGSKQKKRKKKKKRIKSAAEDEDGHVDGNVEENSVLKLENGGKKKKKKRKSDHTDVEALQTNTMAEHVTDSRTVLKKKRKKETNETSDLPQIPTEHPETGESLKKSLEVSHVQRKKHKKKKRAAFNDNHVGEGSCTDVDFNNDAANSSVSTGLSVQKKSISETCMDVFYTQEEDETAGDDQKAAQSLEEQDAAAVTKKKKKKKKKEKLSLNLAEETETQSDYAASAREKKKTSSFLVADEEEDASMAGNPAISKSKKKKKKRSAEENVERETEIEPPKETGQRVLSETGIRNKKKKRKRNESELISSAERAADVDGSQTDEAVVVGKKKKKKKKKGKQEIPPSSAEDPEAEKSCASFSPIKTAKHGHSDESSICNYQESRETPGQDALLSLSPPKDKKKKKAKAAHSHVLEVKSSMDPAEVETPRSKKQRKEPTADSRLSSSLSQTSLSQRETLPSNWEKKSMKGKRRLHNPNEDFL